MFLVYTKLPYILIANTIYFLFLELIDTHFKNIYQMYDFMICQTSLLTRQV